MASGLSHWQPGIEAEEIALEKYLTFENILVGFGSGLGIAAAGVHRAINPKAHFCFEADLFVAS